jgi:hypothetical protein
MPLLGSETAAEAFISPSVAEPAVNWGGGTAFVAEITATAEAASAAAVS